GVRTERSLNAMSTAGTFQLSANQFGSHPKFLATSRTGKRQHGAYPNLGRVFWSSLVSIELSVIFSELEQSPPGMSRGRKWDFYPDFLSPHASQAASDRFGSQTAPCSSGGSKEAFRWRVAATRSCVNAPNAEMHRRGPGNAILQGREKTRRGPGEC